MQEVKIFIKEINKVSKKYKQSFILACKEEKLDVCIKMETKMLVDMQDGTSAYHPRNVGVFVAKVQIQQYRNGPEAYAELVYLDLLTKLFDVNNK